MAFKPGHKKVGGRKKGAITRDRQMLLDKAKELGVDPFEINLRIASGDWKGLGYASAERQCGMTPTGIPIYEDQISTELRQKAASDACQFMLPKLKAIEVENKDDFKPHVIYVSQWGSKVESVDDDEGSD